MERCWEIGKINLKYNLLPHVLLGIGFCCISYLFMSVQGLESPQVAQVLETYLALSGIILLLPVFHPEQNRDIRDLLGSKYTSMTLAQVIRFLQALLLLGLILLGCVWYLHLENQPFPLWKFYWGTFAEAFFFGCLGLLAYSLSDQMVIGYMIPCVYYVCNYGDTKLLGKFHAFTMMRGSYEEKIWLAAGGVVCLAVALCFRRQRR